MTPVMPPQPAATAGPPSLEETNGSVEEKGPHCCRKRKRNQPKLPILRGRYIEVDENDIIRDLGMDPDRGPEIFVTPTYKQNHEAVETPPRKISHNPIQWRLHSEVAIEVMEFKQAIALHDLVDENNAHLMVITRDNAIIQGHIDQVMEMRATVWQSWDFDKKQKERRGGLVNIHHEYIPMDWKKAEQLMSKEFPETSDGPMVIMEFRPADPSPQGNLKPGRRLVRVND
ncbi:hypothetical protein F5Y00DRAFT_265037 [Daldinia vernicosa]|uniref:uncharacterized protein n=1 Tax=Daldinia vernicosa TaxID=114800 RepID=UPI00200840BA|nr:uncharacterized protein F5Y00DRAFT_265037 [Daldinia vernicosa]KAI0845993.1 hypothetical protein F5Y00DRAFT_265037 [Daldinia vernicosa]